MSEAQKALAYLRRDALAHVDMLEPLRLGSARVLCASARGVLMREERSGAYMLSAEDEEAGASLIARVPACDLAAVHGAFLAAPLAARFGLSKRMDCRQAVYERRTPPRFEGPLSVRPLTAAQLPLVRAQYALADEEELILVAQGGCLFGGFFEERLIGFIGLHLEGSMGMLEVLEPYRRRGFGAQLEAFLIGRLLERGRVPYAQIVEGNEKSLALQAKMGLTLAPGRVHWLMR